MSANNEGSLAESGSSDDAGEGGDPSNDEPYEDNDAEQEDEDESATKGQSDEEDHDSAEPSPHPYCVQVLKNMSVSRSRSCITKIGTRVQNTSRNILNVRTK